MVAEAMLALDVKNIVGESIVYDELRNSLFWVDIIAHEVHELSLDAGAHRRLRINDCSLRTRWKIQYMPMAGMAAAIR